MRIIAELMQNNNTLNGYFSTGLFQYEQSPQCAALQMHPDIQLFLPPPPHHAILADLVIVQFQNVNIKVLLVLVAVNHKLRWRSHSKRGGRVNEAFLTVDDVKVTANETLALRPCSFFPPTVCGKHLVPQHLWCSTFDCIRCVSTTTL